MINFDIEGGKFCTVLKRNVMNCFITLFGKCVAETQEKQNNRFRECFYLFWVPYETKTGIVSILVIFQDRTVFSPII